MVIQSLEANDRNVPSSNDNKHRKIKIIISDNVDKHSVAIGNTPAATDYESEYCYDPDIIKNFKNL